MKPALITKKMKKLKWEKLVESYYSENRHLNFRITKSGDSFRLSKMQYLSWESVACFNKLTSAKKVAQLIYNG